MTAFQSFELSQCPSSRKAVVPKLPPPKFIKLMSPSCIPRALPPLRTCTCALLLAIEFVNIREKMLRRLSGRSVTCLEERSVLTLAFEVSRIPAEPVTTTA